MGTDSDCHDLNILDQAHRHHRQRTPSSFNIQPSQIIMIQDQTVKEHLAEHAMVGPGNQFRVKDCAALAVFLSDLEAHKRIQRILQLEKEHKMRHPNFLAIFPMTTNYLLGEGHTATMLKQITSSVLSSLRPMPTIDPIMAWSYKNTGLLAQSYVLAAQSHDLATAIMEGYDSARASQVLHIPDRYAIPMMVATGYDWEKYSPEEVLAPRLDLQEMVFSDHFGEPYCDHPPSTQPSPGNKESP